MGLYGRMKREDSVLHTKSYAFAVRVVRMVKLLNTDRRLYALYDQVLRSGTSISANIRESEFAQSHSDFISKLSIALKEANETTHWLDLLKDAECLSDKQHKSMTANCDELIALLVSSIKTAKTNKDIINK